MPKINIYDDSVSGFRVEVGWTPDQVVQVGTTNEHSTLRLPFEDPNGQAGGTEPFNGWFATLDRAGCNRLIYAVREARDAAYGADA